MLHCRQQDGDLSNGRLGFVIYTNSPVTEKKPRVEKNDLCAVKTLFGTDLFKTLMNRSEFSQEAAARKCGNVARSTRCLTLFNNIKSLL